MKFKRTSNTLLLILGTLMLFNCSNMWGSKKPVLLLDKEELKEVQKAEKQRRSLNARSEVTAFGVDPDPNYKITSVDDSRYLTVTEIEDFSNLKDVDGNYVDKGAPFNNHYNNGTHTLENVRTKTIEISGIHITIEDGNANRIHDTYNCLEGQEANHKISNMHIYADTLIIKDEFRLPATNVKIYARRLVFQDDGCIITSATPVTVTAPNTTQLTDGTYELGSGYDGFDAGDIEVYVEKYEDDGSKQERFTMNGAQGQQAGNGKSPGSVAAFKSAARYGYDNVIYYEHKYYSSPGLSKRTEESDDDDDYAGQDFALQKSSWPQDGKDAFPPGVPGKGGNGGSLVSNIELKDYCKADAGKAGLIAAGENAIGQPAQEPRVAYKIWIKTITYNIPRKTKVKRYEVHYAKDGKSFQAKNNIPGKPGIAKKIDKEPKIWLNPYTIKMIVQYTKDAYLNGHFHYARIVFEKYQNLIPEFNVDPAEAAATTHEELAAVENAWDAGEYTKTSEEWKTELAELKNEIAIELAKIANDRDYFNNPAGYVPVLSFEANRALFVQEYEHAIETIYYSKMLLEKNLEHEKQDANARELVKLYAEKLAAHRAVYDEAVKSISSLESETEAIAAREDQAIGAFNDVTARLVARAKENAARKMPFWKKAAKVVSTAAQACPVYQPALGGVGKGIDAAIAYQEGDKWEAVKMIPSIAKDLKFDKSYQQTHDWIHKNLNTTATAQTLSAFYDESLPGIFDNGTDKDLDFYNAWDQFDPGSETSMDMLKRYRKNCVDIYKAVKPIKNDLMKLRKTMNNVQISDADIKHEFDKLVAVDTEYKGVNDLIAVLRKQKAEFQTKLNNTLTEIATASTGILHCKLVIKSLAECRQNHLSKTIDNKAKVYLKEMKKRSEDRLLYYYYLLRKSYEYRTLQSFTAAVSPAYGGLDMRKFIDDKFGDIVEGTSDADGKLLLKNAYRQMLSDVTNSILATDAISTKQQYTVFELDSSVLEKLNSGEQAVINLIDDRRFLSDREDVRITGIEVTEMDLSLKPGAPGPLATGELELSFKHPGISRIFKDGKTYRFRHFSNNEIYKHDWRSSYNILTSQISNAQPATSTVSMLNAILGTSEGTMLFARYGAWADLTVKKVCSNDANNANIDRVRVRVDYEYNAQKDDQRDINLFIALQDETAPAKIIRTSNLSPFFEFSKEDIAEHKNGYGALKRFYNSSDGSVSIRAPKYFGCYHFEGFLGWDGNPAAGTVVSDVESATITVNLNSDHDIYAQYKEIIAYELDENGDILLDENSQPIRKSAFDIFGANYVDGYIDSDFDNLPDHWEMHHFGNLDSTDEDDNDDDGMSNIEEYRNKTIPFGSADFNSDGIPDCIDRDGDTIPDRVEIEYGFDPHKDEGEKDPIRDDNGNIIWSPTDHDGDGIPNSEEFADNRLTNEQKTELELLLAANSDDTDGDGMPDVWEDYFGLDKNDASDAGKDLDSDGLNNLLEYMLGLNPDGGSNSTIWDYFFDDSGNDGGHEQVVGEEAALEALIALNPVDTDGDGMPDLWEDYFGLNKNNPSDAFIDLDGDGITNIGEYSFMLDPRRKDNYSPLPCKRKSVLNIRWPNHCTGHCD